MNRPLDGFPASGQPINVSASSTTTQRNGTSYRDRILLFYSHYCPEKATPAQVDFLLSKYRGFEEHIIDVLTERYGPEPPVPAGMSSAGASPPPLGQEPAPQEPHVLEQPSIDSPSRGPSHPPYRYFQPGHTAGASAGLGTGPHGDRSDAQAPAGPTAPQLEEALAQRQRGFERDMDLVRKQQAQRAEANTARAVTEVRLEIQRQQVELQQLRLVLSSSAGTRRNAAEDSDSSFATFARQRDDSTQRVKQLSKELVAARMELLAAESHVDPQRVARRRMEREHQQTAEVEQQLGRSVQYCRCLAEVVRRHLQAYPLSPLQVSLRERDPAMCARLEQTS